LTKPEEILTTDEVAALLKVPLATLYQWMSRGESPPYYKIGRYARFKRSEVIAWSESHVDEPSRRLP
jgi:excisionase family DNA binding protein